jgi:hypothetical protein
MSESSTGVEEAGSVSFHETDLGVAAGFALLFPFFSLSPYFRVLHHIMI